MCMSLSSVLFCFSQETLGWTGREGGERAGSPGVPAPAHPGVRPPHAGLLTACSFSVSSRRRFRHLAAASLFLSLRIRRFSSSSGDS